MPAALLAHVVFFDVRSEALLVIEQSVTGPANEAVLMVFTMLGEVEPCGSIVIAPIIMA